MALEPNSHHSHELADQHVTISIPISRKLGATLFAQTQNPTCFAATRVRERADRRALFSDHSEALRRGHLTSTSPNRQRRRPRPWTSQQHLEHHSVRSCSSCDFSRQDLHSNRLPGSREGRPAAADKLAAPSRESHGNNEGETLEVRVQELAPRVTLFKDSTSSKLRPDRQVDNSPTRISRPQEQEREQEGGRQQAHSEQYCGTLSQHALQLEQLEQNDRRDWPSGPTLKQKSEFQQTQWTAATNEQLATNERSNGSLSECSKRLLSSSEDYKRVLWRAARNHQQQDHYDYSLFGLNVHLDKAVAQHQRETMLYNQGKSIARNSGTRARSLSLIGARARNPLSFHLISQVLRQISAR